MKRALAFVLLLAVSACARGAEVTLLSEEELPAGLYGDRQDPTVEPRTVRALVYFVRTDSQGFILMPERLGAVVREEETNLEAAEYAMRELLDRPTAQEREAGFHTAIPPGTVLLGVSVRGNIADVNLTAQFESAGAEVLNVLRIAQVVWTLTELPEIDAVRFRIHGAPQPVIDQLGVAHEVVGRGRYSRFEPRDLADPEVLPGAVEAETTAEGSVP